MDEKKLSCKISPHDFLMQSVTYKTPSKLPFDYHIYKRTESKYTRGWFISLRCPIHGPDVQ